jgi:hypothetical protein
LTVGDRLYEIYRFLNRVKSPEKILIKLILVFGRLYSKTIFPKEFIEILEKLGELAGIEDNRTKMKEKEDALLILRSLSEKKESVELFQRCEKVIEAILKGITSREKIIVDPSVDALIQIILLLGGKLNSEDKITVALGSINEEQFQDHFTQVVRMLEDLSRHKHIDKLFSEKLFIKISVFVYNRQTDLKMRLQ